MIDVQIVAGKRLDVLAESLFRILQQGKNISHVYIKNNTDQEIPIKHSKVTIVPKDEPKTFEQNHNQLAKLGSNPFILFVDDDAFTFPGAVETFLEKIQSDPKIACVGGVNNQTYPSRVGLQEIPTVGSLTEFKMNEKVYEEVAKNFTEKNGGSWLNRLWIPGNFLLVRREIWQKEYGGWDEGYRNWNEEVDFLLWCYEHDYKVMLTPGVWFYHCQAQSRGGQQLQDNILESSRHFEDKWPAYKIKALVGKMSRNNNQVLKEITPELDLHLTTNKANTDIKTLRANQYYVIMRGLLPD